VSTWISFDTVGLRDRKGDQLVMPGCAKCQSLSVSVNAMQTSVTHQLLKVKQTTVQFEENSALQSLLHSVVLASFTADMLFGRRVTVIRSVIL